MTSNVFCWWLLWLTLTSKVAEKIPFKKRKTPRKATERESKQRKRASHYYHRSLPGLSHPALNHKTIETTDSTLQPLQQLGIFENNKKPTEETSDETHTFFVVRESHKECPYRSCLQWLALFLLFIPFLVIIAGYLGNLNLSHSEEGMTEWCCCDDQEYSGNFPWWDGGGTVLLMGMSMCVSYHNTQ